MKKIYLADQEQTHAFGRKLASMITPGFLITLHGDLGAGKTTFTKYLGEGLGVRKTINSPTFTILKSYQGRMPLHHMDAYRLEGVHQDLGFEELFDDDACCVVEWADFIADQLPAARLDITIERLNDNERTMHVCGYGEMYEKIEREL